jgi:hypothetical protein
VSTWDDPEQYARCVAQSYRRDFWNQQPVRCEVWSEKGTVRGVLQPVLNQYAVGFNPVHGFNSATNTHNAADDDDGRELSLAMQREGSNDSLRRRLAFDHKVPHLALEAGCKQGNQGP